MPTQGVLRHAAARTTERPDPTTTPATASEPNLMVQKYGADPAARTCACCYLLAYRTLPTELRKRPVYPNVYPCTNATDWPADQPACKLWRPIPQAAIRLRKAR